MTKQMEVTNGKYSAQNAVKIGQLEVMTKNIDENVKRLETTITDAIRALRDEMRQIVTDATNKDVEYDRRYMSREEFKAKFEPVRLVVYGLVGTLLVGFLAAITKLVYIK